MRTGRRRLAGLLGLSVVLAVGLLGQPAAQAAPRGPSPSVVGGTDAAPGEFPWAVRLSVGCGGAVVAPRVVLTAAHCVRRTGSYTGYTATIGRTRLSDTTTGEVIGSTYIYRSPQYPSTGSYDWALVELSRATSAPALALVNQGDTSFNSGTFTILGWGATREGGSQSPTLKKADVPFVSDAQCAAAYDELVPAVEICAGYSQAGSTPARATPVARW